MRNAQASFLRLPAELRLRVYEELLILRKDELVGYDFTEVPVREILEPKVQNIDVSRLASSLRTSNSKASALDSTLSESRNHSSHSRPFLCAAILRVCKQTYTEAVQTLYRENIFMSNNPSSMQHVIDRLGETVLGHLRSLQIHIELMSDNENLPIWVRLLGSLSTKAYGLRYLKVLFTIEMYPVRFNEQFLRVKGSDRRDDLQMLDLVRSLTELQQLDELELHEYYPAQWVDHLRQVMPQTRVKGISRLLRNHLTATPDDTYESWLSRRLENELRTLAETGLLGTFDCQGNRISNGVRIYVGDLGHVEQDYLDIMMMMESASDQTKAAEWQDIKAELVRTAREHESPENTFWSRYQRRVEHLVP